MGFLDRFKRGLDALKAKIAGATKWTDEQKALHPKFFDAPREEHVTGDLFAGLTREEIMRSFRGIPPQSWFTKKHTPGVRRKYRKVLGCMSKDQREACMTKWGSP